MSKLLIKVAGSAHFIDLLTAMLVVLCAVLAPAFYATTFWRFNRATELAPFYVKKNSFDSYRMAVDECRSSISKISVRGWIARPGLHRKRHATVIVLRDVKNGRMYAMHTDIENRKDVTASLNHDLGDKIDYDNSGFSASLNVAFSHPEIHRARSYVAFDPGNGNSLQVVPLPCDFSASP